MKFGVRKPSFRKSIAARTSSKRFIRHNLGLKAPRGYGWLTNPKKAAYNRVYNRTTFSASKGIEGFLIGLVFTLAFALIVGVVKIIWAIVLAIFQGLQKNQKANEPNPIDHNVTNTRIKIKYRDARNRVTERIVQVNKFDLKSLNPSIRGFCESQNAERTFRIDRIMECTELSSGNNIYNFKEYFTSKMTG